MMKPFFPLLLLIFSLFSCKNDAKTPAASDSANGPAAAQQEAAPAPRKHIVFFGNSITAAYQLSPEQGFTHLVQMKIDSLGLPYTCVNAGLSGETTADGVSRIDWILEQPIEIFVLELGGNDALRGLPLSESKKNLQLIIDKVKAKYPDCKIIVAGMMAPPNLGSYAKEFYDIFPALAKRNNAALIPFILEGVGGDPSLNLPDGIHPNVEGHRILAETVWQTLRPLL
ncbi:MAG: arylesterase [Saprospiraceae bacterium]|nr:arylesterase [Saprospiraceae bacterium]